MVSSVFYASLQALLLAAPVVGVFDALSPRPDEDADSTFTRTLDIAMASGESEVLHVILWNDGAKRTLETCELVWDGEFTTTDRVYGAKSKNPGSAAVLDPDTRLDPFTPIALGPGETAHLLLDSYVTPGTTPGRFAGHLRLQFAGGEEVERAISLEVFDFALPARPSLVTLLGLDRTSFHDRYGMDAALHDWSAIYDTLTHMRTGFQVWPQEHATGDVFYDDRDVSLIKEHLDHVVRAPTIPAIGIGGQTGDLLVQWPPPAFNAPQDPLQLLLFSLMANLEAAGWQAPTILIPARLPPRETWQEFRTAYARVARADERVARLLAAPIHPYFERYAEIWALPPTTPPFALALLREGRSLIRYPLPEFAARKGTPGSAPPANHYQSAPEDAFDGCEFTAWYPDTGAAEGGPWLEVEFSALEPLESLAILWPSGVTPVVPEVETAYHPGSYTTATVRWDKSSGWSEGGNGISHGTFRYPRDCIALRLRFAADSAGGVAVAEVLINQDARVTVDSLGKSAQPWLDLRDHTMEEPGSPGQDTRLRLLPWVCWQRGFQGILGPVLDASRSPDGLAVYPAEAGTAAPSLGLLHLRDGLEDFEYLQLYWRAVQREEVAPPEKFKPGYIGAAPGPIDPEARLELRRRLGEERLQMGRLLSGQSIVTRNFGPSRTQ